MKHIKLYEELERFKVDEVIKRQNNYMSKIGIYQFCRIIKKHEGFGKVFWYDLIVYKDDGSTYPDILSNINQNEIYKLTKKEKENILIKINTKKYNL